MSVLELDKVPLTLIPQSLFILVQENWQTNVELHQSLCLESPDGQAASNQDAVHKQ